jgi:iron-only hydrogenase group A
MEISEEHKMVTIEVNGRSVEANPGEMLLHTLRRCGVQVPTLCHLEGLLPSGACRMCVVEIEGQRGLIPSCAYPVTQPITVQTHSARAVLARRTIVELLLANHPDDCLYCVRNHDCQLQDLARQLGVRQRRYAGAKNRHFLDMSSPSITRDPAKCVLCGKCVRVCEEVQHVGAIDFIGRGSQAKIGTAFDDSLNVSTCIHCGQCVVVCPTGALAERSHIPEVLAALRDPAKTVVVQHAPAVSVTVGEAFGLPAGADAVGAMTGALRRLGFDRVFDTSFTADLTIMEEASELVHRLQNGGSLPMLTSCSPGWIKFVETHYPDFIGNLSTCKSPQQMMGAVIKSYFAQREGLDPQNIYSVSIMPCTAKKFEAARPEMARNGVADIDAVLTTRELIQLLHMHGLHLGEIPAESPDTPFGQRTTAGKLFGATGGVMEAAIRTAYWMVTNRELETLTVEAVRGTEGVKQASVDVDGLTFNVAVASGLGNACRVLDEIRSGRNDLHFIEVMTCPGGCVAGGGQPGHADLDAVRKRMQGLYALDRQESVRTSHRNAAVRQLYDEFLGQPLGHTSHQLLHTHYAPRDVSA